MLVDEAHRSQEGQFGKAWRAAVPNARFFGMTGTAIEDKNRSTFRLFGDPDDPGFVMSRYTMEHSIADGFTVPVVVEGRSVGFDLDKAELDEAFDELAEQEGLDEDEKVYLSGKASHVETILSNPARVAAVCANIVDHYLTHVAPLGQKAQVVAYNQATRRRLRAGHRGGTETPRLPAARTPGGKVQHRRRRHARHRGQERQEGTPAVPADRRAGGGPQAPLQESRRPALVRCSHRQVDDRLQRPIEGVLYLDKPLKAANLFQTITRPNRPWRNPLTGQRKDFGRVVDYVGLAKAIGEALAGPQPRTGEPDEVHVVDVSQLVGKFVTDLTRVEALFAGIDKTEPGLRVARRWRTSGSETAARHATSSSRVFVALQTVWEFLDPAPDAAAVQDFLPVAGEGLREHSAQGCLQDIPVGTARRQDAGPHPLPHDQRDGQGKPAPQRHPRPCRTRTGQADRRAAAAPRPRP